MMRILSLTVENTEKGKKIAEAIREYLQQLWDQEAISDGYGNLEYRIDVTNIQAKFIIDNFWDKDCDISFNYMGE